MWWASLGPAASQTPQDKVLMVAKYFRWAAFSLLFITPLLLIREIPQL